MGNVTGAMAQPNWIEEDECLLGVKEDSFHLGVGRAERWGSLDSTNLW